MVTFVQRCFRDDICIYSDSFGCRCAAYPANSDAEAELNAETQKYRDVLVELVNTERYDTREDFTVTIQPFFSTTTLPKKVCVTKHKKFT